MAASQKIVELLLKYGIAGVDQTIAGTQRVRDSLDNTAGAELTVVDASNKLDEALGRATRARGIETLADQWKDVYAQTKNADDATLAVERSLRAIGATSSEFDQVAASIVNLQNEQKKLTAGQQITALGRGIFNAPAIGASTPIARGLIGGGAVVDALGLSLTQVVTIAGTAGVVLGAAAIALDVHNKRLEEERKIAERISNIQLSAQQRYVRAIIDDLTSDDVRKAQQQLQRETGILQLQYVETAGSIQRLNQEQAAKPFFDQLRDWANGTTTDTSVLEASQSALSDQIKENIALDQRYSFGLEVGTFPTINATKAEEALAAAREKTANALAGQYQEDVQTRLKLSQLRRDGTTEQVNSILTANQDEETILRNFLIPALDDLGVSSQDARLHLSNLVNEDKLLVENVEPVIAAREREAKALVILNANNQSYLDALTQEGKARDKLTELTDAYTKASQKAGEAVQKVQDNLIDKEAQINQKAADATTKEDAKAAKDREKALKDHNKKLLDIEQTRQEAIAARDQAGLQKADEARDKENTDYQERLDELQKSLDDQHALIEASRMKEQQDAQDAARKSIQDLRDKWATEESDRQLAIAQARADLTNAQTAVKLTNQQYYIDELNAKRAANAALVLEAFDAGNRIVAAFQAGVQNAIFTTTYNWKPTQLPINPVVNQPFLPPLGFGANRAGQSGGLSIPITVIGNSKQQILNAVWQDLDTALTSHGVD